MLRVSSLQDKSRDGDSLDLSAASLAAARAYDVASRAKAMSEPLCVFGQGTSRTTYPASPVVVDVPEHDRGDIRHHGTAAYYEHEEKYWDAVGRHIEWTRKMLRLVRSTFSRSSELADFCRDGDANIAELEELRRQ